MRRVLITGCSRGIGLALVPFVLADGDDVFATCRSPDTADELQVLADNCKRQLSVLRLDLTDSSSHTAVRNYVLDRTGALDILINNAAVYVHDHSVSPEASHRSIDHVEARTLLEMFRVNTVAPLAVTRALLPLLRKGDCPKVVFMSSGMASINNKDGREIEYGYSASKAALNMLTRVLSHELRADGISVAAISPGWVATDMGTPSAPLKPDEVAEGLWNVIKVLDTSQSGTFLDWHGDRIPW